MQIPEKLLYSEDHEWICQIEDNLRVGITEYAQGELGDIIFMELPTIGSKIKKGDSIGTIEAVKTVADVYAPVSGEIVEVNLKLEDNPELINGDPYDNGWIVIIKPDTAIDLSDHLDASGYEKFIGK